MLSDSPMENLRFFYMSSAELETEYYKFKEDSIMQEAILAKMDILANKLKDDPEYLSKEFDREAERGTELEKDFDWDDYIYLEDDVSLIYEDEYNCEHTDEVVCPYCGCKQEDSYDFNLPEDSNKLIQCQDCRKEFYATLHVEYSFYSEKATYGTCSVCGEKHVVVEDLAHGIFTKNSVGVNCCFDKTYDELLIKMHEKRKADYKKENGE